MPRAPDWRFCHWCLSHHPPETVTKRVASFKDATREVTLCQGCDGKPNRREWLAAVGRARYLMTHKWIDGQPLEEAKAERQ